MYSADALLRRSIGYSFFLTAFVYPVVAHWEWSATGWLSPTRVGGSILFGSGLLDFAGCGAVHMVGGISGIVGAALLGPRVGRFGYDGQARAMPGHNVPFAALGTFVLWFGWYGFNCGSTGSIINASAIASRVAVSTTLGGAAGGIAALSWAVTMDNVWDVTMALNGILAGLVSITSGCAFFEPWAAIIAGGVGGILFPIFSRILTRFKIDDPLEAGAMHGGCGAWGLLATGLLAQTKAVNAAYAVGAPDNGLPLRPGGGFYGHGQALAAQIVGIVTIGAWTAVNMFACFWLLRRFNLLRVPVDFEAMGMDESFHGGTAYPGEDTTVPLAYEAAPAGKQVELTNEPAAASGQL
jgi:Amt family ammonium transporter